MRILISTSASISTSTLIIATLLGIAGCNKIGPNDSPTAAPRSPTTASPMSNTPASDAGMASSGAASSASQP